MDHDVQKIPSEGPGLRNSGWTATRRAAKILRFLGHTASVLVKYHRHGHRNVPVIISVLKKNSVYVIFKFTLEPVIDGPCSCSTATRPKFQLGYFKEMAIFTPTKLGGNIKINV